MHLYFGTMRVNKGSNHLLLMGGRRQEDFAKKKIPALKYDEKKYRTMQEYGYIALHRNFSVSPLGRTIKFE